MKSSSGGDVLAAVGKQYIGRYITDSNNKMRFSTSALVIVLLQNSSWLSPNDAFSPPLSRVIKSSSSSNEHTKDDGLYARHDDDQNENNNDNSKSRIVSSMLLGGAAFQLSTSKVSAC